MKPKGIFSCLMLLAVVGFSVFGAVNRLSYPETTANPDYMSQLQVATLSKDGCDIVVQDMQQELPQSPIILRVSPTSDLIPIFYAGKQRFRVEEVYAGNHLKAGDEIWIVSGSWCALIDEVYQQMVFYFVNAPKQGQEYLVFLSGQVEIVDGFEPLPTFQLQNRILIDPIFCYTDLDTQVDTPPGQLLDITIPYREVSNQEFFAESQAVMDALMEAKHALLAQYPKGN